MTVALLTPTALAERLELATQDWRFQRRGERTSETRVVLLDITDSTLREWSEPQVFWGPRLAQALGRGRSLGATWMGLDVIPTAAAGPYLEATYGIEEERSVPTLARELARGRVFLAWDGVNQPLPQLLYAREEQPEDVGLVNRWPEPDEVVRRAALGYPGEDGHVSPTLPAGMALRLLNRQPAEVSSLIRTLPVGSTDSHGTFYINYVGRPGSFAHLPIERVAAGKLSAAERQWFKGAIVLIGAAYTGANDVHRGPFGVYQGTEILAHTLATLLDRRPLRPLPVHQVAWISVLVALGSAGACLLLAPRWLLVGTGVTVASWMIAAVAAFQTDLLWPVASPLLTLTIGVAGYLSAQSFAEARHRKQVETIFGQHVSHRVVSRLLRQPELARLGGERREVTVLFSDLRGFTEMSDGLSPQQVVECLNLYLPSMEDLVFRHGGTLDKYIGDAVMAFWNAPEDQPDHALQAVSTALEMVATLEDLNREWRSRGLPELYVRIGINTGPAMVGYVGSERLKSYTVIGGTVNEASRLEGANKELGTVILIGERTYQLIQGEVPVQSHQIGVKGIARTLPVYEVLIPGRVEPGTARQDGDGDHAH